MFKLGKLGKVGAKTQIQRAIAVLRSFGPNAHVYLPGIGMLNGLQAANYIDSAGTQVGVVDQPVGLDLDAMGGLGVELVVNGDFSNGSTGWTLVNGATVSGGQLLLSIGNATAIFSGVTCTTGKTYKFEFDYVSGAGTQFINIQAGSALFGVATDTVAKRYSGFIVATSTDNIKIWQDGGVAGSAVIDNISVREISGIHASQTTTGSKPILRQDANGKYYWQFDGSNDSLQLGGPLFQMSDDWCVTAAINVSAAGGTWGTVFGQRGGGTSSRVQLYFSDGMVRAYLCADVGPSIDLAADASSSGVTQVCTLLKRSGTVYLRINGVQKASRVWTPGTTTLDGYAIGSLAGVDYLLGAIFGITSIKGTVSNPDLLLLEKLVANLSGVTI